MSQAGCGRLNAGVVFCCCLLLQAFRPKCFWGSQALCCIWCTSVKASLQRCRCCLCYLVQQCQRVLSFLLLPSGGCSVASRHSLTPRIELSNESMCLMVLWAWGWDCMEIYVYMSRWCCSDLESRRVRQSRQSAKPFRCYGGGGGAAWHDYIVLVGLILITGRVSVGACA